MLHLLREHETGLILFKDDLVKQGLVGIKPLYVDRRLQAIRINGDFPKIS